MMKIRRKQKAKSLIRTIILDKSAVRGIFWTENPSKISAISEIRLVFFGKSDDPKTYSPPPPEWISVCVDIVESVKHMHSKGYLHCDLKTNNVLVFKKGDL